MYGFRNIFSNISGTARQKVVNFFFFGGGRGKGKGKEKERSNVP